MIHRLIMIEGIPGSGKTTIAGKLKEHLVQQGIKATLFREGDAHPVDMAWNAYLSLDEYERIIEKNRHHAAMIRSNTQFVDGNAIVAYTKLNFSEKDRELRDFFEVHEVYDGRIDFETFKRLHFTRWRRFVEDYDGEAVVIFECSFLQNHVNELLAFHSKDESYIERYMNELAEIVLPLEPMLIYLSQPDVRETIRRVAVQRVSEDKSMYRDWIDMVIDYVEQSSYGRRNALKGFDGVIDFLCVRKEIELKLLDNLPLHSIVIQNSEYQWDQVFKQITESLKLA